MRFLKEWWAELLIGCVLSYFALRELGTFPEAWADDSLFMIVARNLAEGRGYQFPIFSEPWHYPFFLAVGPTVILPAALAGKLFGFSVVTARAGMLPYMFAAVALLYAYVRKIDTKTSARLATALLVTFSAFINTGKPVLGEVPAFLFILIGIWMLRRQSPKLFHGCAAGAAFGMAVVTKITAGVIFPALGLAFIAALMRRDFADAKLLMAGGVTSFVMLALFLPVLGYSDPVFVQELIQYGFAGGGSTFLSVLRTQPELLIRFQYLAYGLFLCTGLLGIWNLRSCLSRREIIIAVSLIALITLYFLNERGWYRHLLLSHFLLLCFVPAGFRFVLQKKAAIVSMLFIVLIQAWWQWDFRGSGHSMEAQNAASVLENSFAQTDLLFVRPEVYVRVPYNPRWQFLSDEFQARTYSAFGKLPVRSEQHCLPIVQKLSMEAQAEYGSRITKLAGRYVIIAPPQSCARRS